MKTIEITKLTLSNMMHMAFDGGKLCEQYLKESNGVITEENVLNQLIETAWTSQIK